MSAITGYNPATTATAFSSGTYRHVALTISGTIHTLYLDGSAVAQNLSGGNVFASYTSAISQLYIGCASDLSYGLTGLIDDFRVYNRALPATDISSLYYTVYNKPAYLLYDPIQYYAFDISNNNALFETVTGKSTVTSSTGLATNVNVNAIYGASYISYIKTISGLGSLYSPNANNGNYAFMNPVNIGSSNGITVCFWFNISGYSPQYGSIYVLTPTNVSGAGGNQIRIQFNGGTSMIFDWYNTNETANSTQFSFNADINTIFNTFNTWNFFAFTLNSTNPNSNNSITVNLYAKNIGGSIKTQSNTIANKWSYFQNTNLYSILGSDTTAPTYGSFPGYFDSFRVFKTALDSTQIQNIINLT